MDALEELRRETQAIEAAEELVRNARRRRNAKIIKLMNQGIYTQQAIAGAARLTREHVRRIVDADRRRHGTRQSNVTPTPREFTS